jgi:hypothetical protein
MIEFCYSGTPHLTVPLPSPQLQRPPYPKPRKLPLQQLGRLLLHLHLLHLNSPLHSLLLLPPPLLPPPLLPPPLLPPPLLPPPLLPPPLLPPPLLPLSLPLRACTGESPQKGREMQGALTRAGVLPALHEKNETRGDFVRGVRRGSR